MLQYKEKCSTGGTITIGDISSKLIDGYDKGLEVVILRALLDGKYERVPVHTESPITVWYLLSILRSRGIIALQPTREAYSNSIESYYIPEEKKLEVLFYLGEVDDDN